MNLGKPLHLALVGVAMFGFGFLLVPLYSVICEWTGLNGKTAGVYEESEVDERIVDDRVVTIQFVSNHNANLDWPFSPVEEQVKVKLGERRQVMFNVVNPTSLPVVAQAVPSVSPAEAAPYLHKIECFCFQQQDLIAGESKDMPLVFFVDAELPDHIKKLTLSYTMYDMTPETPVLAAGL